MGGACIQNMKNNCFCKDKIVKVDTLKLENLEEENDIRENIQNQRGRTNLENSRNNPQSLNSSDQNFQNSRGIINDQNQVRSRSKFNSQVKSRMNLRNYYNSYNNSNNNSHNNSHNNSIINNINYLNNSQRNLDIMVNRIKYPKKNEIFEKISEDKDEYKSFKSNSDNNIDINLSKKKIEKKIEEKFNKSKDKKIPESHNFTNNNNNRSRSPKNHLDFRNKNDGKIKQKTRSTDKSDKKSESNKGESSNLTNLNLFNINNYNNINNSNKKEDFFIDKIINTINLARTNGLLFNELIIKHAKEIQGIETIKDIEGELDDESRALIKKNKFFLRSEDKKFFFNNEKSEFLECGERLKDSNLYNSGFSSKDSEDNKLLIKREIMLPILIKKGRIVLEREYILNYLADLNKLNEGKYDVRKFLFFKTSKNPEISLIIQIVQDFYKEDNEKTLLNETYKFIGVDYEIDKFGYYGVFITFSG